MKFSLPKNLLRKLKLRRNLKPHILSLSEAFRLASILRPKIDIEKISPSTDAVEFISDVAQKLSPQEYIGCVMLLTRENEETIKGFASIEILTAFIEGLKQNQIVSLLWFCKSLGL